MAAVNPPITNFSGGIIGGELHNRVDVPSYPNGAEVMRNFRPSLQGVMSRRPPLEHIDAFDDHNAKGRLFKFQFSIDESYLVLATEAGFTFYANDGRITTPSVSASLGVWTDQSTGNGSVTDVGSRVFLDSDGSGSAVAQRVITTSNANVVHIITFEVVHGPINLRIGTTSGDSNILTYSGLRAGYHYLAFTPTSATTHLQFWHDSNAGRILRDSVAILSGPTFSLPNPFAEDDLPAVHTQQIRDVLYMTHDDYWPRRLERRGDRSWSIVKLLPDDGPFDDVNTTSVTLQASNTRGEITLTASDPTFSTDDEGVLFALTAGGQNKSATATAGDTFTDGIKVTGNGTTARSFTVRITGSFSGTVRLQSSSGNENSYANDGSAGPWTSPTSVSIYDARDNQTWFYRLAVPAGDYTSGSIAMEISYQGGSTTGICRVMEYVNSTEVTAEVIEGKNMPSTAATKTWKRGAWNAEDGFPASITDGFGRLWYGRGARVWASKSDDFTSFEEGDEDDQAFSKQVATPSSDAIRWLAMLSHLVVGTASIEKVGLGNTTSEPIGPTNWQFLPGSEEGGSSVQPVTATGSILFVHRSKKKLMQFVQNPKALSDTSYISVDLTARAPEIVDAEIVAMDVQREPERRILVVLASGRMVELLFRREGELDIVAWAEVETDGRVEDVCVLPREDEDVVNVIVRRRNAAGAWERHIERYGSERPQMDCEHYHLDAALAYPLTKPETVATPSAVTGSITITADADAFVSGDVGKVIWLNGGRATITARSNATTITATVTSRLDSTDPCPKYRWGIGTPTSSLTGATHLNGQTVTVYGDQTNLGTVVWNSAGTTLPQSVSVAYVGKTYKSRWLSLKLAYGAQKGTALTMKKAIRAITLLLYRAGATIKYGMARGSKPREAFDRLRPIKTRTPEVPYGEPQPLFSGEVHCAFDTDYNTDARIALEVDGPAPATVSGFVPEIDEHDR